MWQLRNKSFSMIIMPLPFYQSDTALWYCVHAILGFMCEFFSYQDLLKPSEWPSTTFIEEQLFPISVWFSLLGGLPVGLGALRVDLKTSGAEGWFKNPPCVALTLPLHHHVATHLWTEWNPTLWCSPVFNSYFLYSHMWYSSMGYLSVLYCPMWYGVPLCCIPPCCISPCGISPCGISLCGGSPSVCTVVWCLLRRPRCGAPQM